MESSRHRSVNCIEWYTVKRRHPPLCRGQLLIKAISLSVFEMLSLVYHIKKGEKSPFCPSLPRAIRFLIRIIFTMVGVHPGH